MFQGATQFNLNNKQKFAIPIRYREFLLAYCAEALVLTADGCLSLHPQAEHSGLSLTSVSLARFA